MLIFTTPHCKIGIKNNAEKFTCNVIPVEDDIVVENCISQVLKWKISFLLYYTDAKMAGCKKEGHKIESRI